MEKMYLWKREKSKVEKEAIAKAKEQIEEIKKKFEKELET